MPQTRSNKSQTPINSDSFNLIPDLATMSDSLEVIVPVANDAEGDSVATARAAAGWAVSDARPLFVYNQATKTIRVKGTAGWSDMNGPLGLIYEQHVSTVSGATSNGVVYNIASFNFVGFRNYRIVWDSSHMGTDYANSLYYTQIGTCATTDPAAQLTGITVINGRTIANMVGNNVTAYTGPITAYYSPFANTTLQIKFVSTRVLGTGNIQFVGNSNETASYLIYDDGAVI